MKKLLFTLLTLALLTVLLIAGVSANEYDVFNVEENTSLDAPGYLFEISEDTDYIIEDTNSLYHLGGNIYYSETIDEIKDVCDGDDLEYIHSDTILSLLEIPNDSHYLDHQRRYMNLINAENFWDYHIEGKGAVIAIIDTGLSGNHPDIDYSRVISGHNYVNGDNNTSDTNGHGTFVAGVVAGVRNNGIGIAGLLNGVSVVPLKVSDTGDDIHLSSIVIAIYAAVDDYSADVINLSLGSSGDEPAFRSAVEYAEKQNVIVVSAVGNDGTSTILYPAGYPSVIGVGSVDISGTVCNFSQHNSSVYVTAPGKSIASTYYMGGYASGQGTSYSAPFVAAMAAAAKSVWGDDFTLAEFQKLLQLSSKDAGEVGYDTYYGYGIIDMQKFANYIAYYDDLVGHWAYDYALAATEGGLIKGTGSRKFEPESNMSRAMFVTALGRYYESIMGTTISTSDTDTFDDTESGQWYSVYVSWAVKSGIVTGYDNTRFGTNDSVTREQAATFMYRFIEYMNYNTGAINESVLRPFTDASSLGSWARTPMAWAVANGIIQGITYDTLSPSASATRAQATAILIRYATLYSGIRNNAA